MSSFHVNSREVPFLGDLISEVEGADEGAARPAPPHSASPVPMFSKRVIIPSRQESQHVLQTRSSAQGNYSVKSLASNVADSSLSSLSSMGGRSRGRGVQGQGGLGVGGWGGGGWVRG